MSRQGRPVGLIIAVVAVTAAGLLLWMILESGDDDAAASSPAAAPGSAAAGAGPIVREGSDRPGLPQVADAEEARRRGDADRPATETVVDGVRVRDHRRDRTQPIVIPPRPPPAHARQIPRTLTRAISDQILPIVRECGASVPPEARSSKPRADGHVVIAIKNQQVQVTQAAMDLTGVVGASLEPTKQCIQQKALGVTVPAADEADLEGYTIRLSYALP